MIDERRAPTSVLPRACVFLLWLLWRLRARPVPGRCAARSSQSGMAAEAGSEPHASIRMMRAEMAHGEPIFFLGATDTKNRLDAGKHCRTWIEVDVPPVEALKYQSRVDIALVSHAAPQPRNRTPTTYPEAPEH